MDEEQRRRRRIPPMRRLTPALAIALAASALSLLLLAWRLSPLPAEETNLQSIESVLDGRWASFEAALPGEWRSELLGAMSAISTHASVESVTRLAGDLERLATELRTASTAPGGGALARQLVGPLAASDDLRRLADGVRAWRESPWLSLAAWGDGTAARWAPQGDALFAWHVALRHAPLPAWLPGWFGPECRIDPLQSTVVRVRAVASEERSRVLQVRVGSTEWPLPTARVGRCWMPNPLVDRWTHWRESLATDRCDAACAKAIEDRLHEALTAVSDWVTAAAAGSATPAPDAGALPWWVP